MYNENELFAERIKELRKSWGLTQEQMAEMVQLRKTTISNYESGYATPTISTLRRFMLRFNLPASYFLPDTELSGNVHKKTPQLMYGTPIYYYEPSNIDGLRSGEPCLMNSCLTLPSQAQIPKKGCISTSATDNSMNRLGIKKGSFVVIDTENRLLCDKDIFAAIRNNELIIRQYHNTAEGCYMTSESTRIPTGLSIEMIPENDFNVLGKITMVLSKF